MIKIVKIISSTIDAGRRIIKMLRLGKDDIQTSYEAMPFGVDSVPIKDLIALQMETGEKGKTVIVGYINKKQIADVGELRIYATNSAGVEQGSVYLKNTGEAQINGTFIELNGAVNTAVKFAPLQTSLSAQDALINTNFTQIAAVLNTLAPGAYVPTVVTTNIASAQEPTVKMP